MKTSIGIIGGFVIAGLMFVSLCVGFWIGQPSAPKVSTTWFLGQNPIRPDIETTYEDIPVKTMWVGTTETCHLDIAIPGVAAYDAVIDAKACRQDRQDRIVIDLAPDVTMPVTATQQPMLKGPLVFDGPGGCIAVEPTPHGNVEHPCR